MYYVKNLSNRTINTLINIMGRSYLTLSLLLWVSHSIATVLARSTQQVSFGIFRACKKILGWTQITVFSSFRALPACDLPTAPDPTRSAPSSEHATVDQERCSSQVAILSQVILPLDFHNNLYGTSY